MSHDSRHAGHTLLEVVLSLTLLSIVMVSVGSAVMFAAQATPDDDSATATLVRDAEVIGRIAEDLALAKYVPEQSSNAVTVVVADRTGDNIPDRIRYAWSGTPGDPLTYSINGAAAVDILTGVDQFALSYTLKNTTRSLTGPIVAGSEKRLSAFTTLSGGNYRGVTAPQWFGQSMTPSLSSGAIGFQPTRVTLYAANESPNDGVLLVELKSAASGLPDGGTTYATGTMIEDDFSGGGAWETLTFVSPAVVPEGQGLALTMSKSSGTTIISQLRSNTDLLTPGMIYSNNGGDSWSNSPSVSLCHELYGRELTQADGYQVTRTHTTHVQVTLQSAGTGRSALTRRVRLLQAPAKLDAFWEADFDADPTRLDLDADGDADWDYGDGTFPSGSLTNGMWDVESYLEASPADRFNGVVTLALRLRSIDGNGPVVFGPNTVDASGNVLPIWTQLRQDGSGGQELLIYNEITPSDPIARVPGLAQGWQDVELTLLPEEELLSIQVNGVDAGSVALSRTSDPGWPYTCWIGELGSDGRFAEVRIEVGGTYVRDSGGGDGLEDLLELLF